MKTYHCHCCGSYIDLQELKCQCQLVIPMNILFLNHPDTSAESWQTGKEIAEGLDYLSPHKVSHHSYQNDHTLKAALDYHDTVIVNDCEGVGWLNRTLVLDKRIFGLENSLKDSSPAEAIEKLQESLKN